MKLMVHSAEFIYVPLLSPSQQFRLDKVNFRAYPAICNCLPVSVMMFVDSHIRELKAGRKYLGQMMSG